MKQGETTMKEARVYIPPDKGSAPESKVTSPDSVVVFGLDVSQWSSRAQFLLLSGLVFAFYLVYGYLQEWIFRQEGMKPHGW